MTRTGTGARKRLQRQVAISAKAVTVWMRTPEARQLTSILDATHLFETTGACDKTHWHPTIYSRSGHYGPSYHVRKGGSLGVSGIRDPKLACLIAALFNAYEATSGKDVLDLCRI